MKKIPYKAIGIILAIGILFFILKPLFERSSSNIPEAAINEQLLDSLQDIINESETTINVLRDDVKVLREKGKMTRAAIKKISTISDVNDDLQKKRDSIYFDTIRIYGVLADLKRYYQSEGIPLYFRSGGDSLNADDGNKGIEGLEGTEGVRNKIKFKRHPN